MYIDENVHLERIILTDACNFKCSYCYQKFKGNNVMSLEIAKERVKTIKELKKKNGKADININLFGGEPLLNWDVFSFFVEELHDVRGLTLSVLTNGSLLTPDRIKFLKDKYIKVGVSLDGNLYSNLMRVGYNKKSTHSIVEGVVKNLVSNNIDTEINMTIGKNNYKTAKDSIEYIKDFGVRGINLQFMIYDGYALTKHEEDNIIAYAMSVADKNFKIDVVTRKYWEGKSDIFRDDFFWIHTLPNGLSYAYNGKTGFGGDERKAFNLKIGDNANNYNIIKAYDNVSKKEVVINKNNILVRGDAHVF